MKSGQYTQAAMPDPDRASVDIRGVLAGELGTQPVSGDRPSEGFGGVSMTTRDRTATVEPHLWPAYAKRGDRIQALEQAGQPLFEITEDPHDDGTGNRIIIPLVRL